MIGGRISLLSYIFFFSFLFFFFSPLPTLHSSTPHSSLPTPLLSESLRFSICPGKAVGDYEESAAFPWWADLLVRRSDVGSPRSEVCWFEVIGCLVVKLFICLFVISYQVRSAGWGSQYTFLLRYAPSLCNKVIMLQISCLSFCFIILFIFKGISEPAKAGLPWCKRTKRSRTGNSAEIENYFLKFT